jgi:hypothetical protein
MAVFRYKFDAVSGPEVAKRVPGAIVLGPNAPALFVDLTAPVASKPDLDEVMAFYGYTFESQDPTTTPEEEASAELPAHAAKHLPSGSDPLATAAAVELTDSTNAEGAAQSFARSNHTHAHGNRGGGALHAAVTTLINGFMSAADKTKLDGLSGSGITEAQHEVLDTLVHDLSETSYLEVTRTSGQVSDVTVWTDSGKTIKVREALVTRSAGQASVVVEKQYNGAGTLVQTLAHTITRSAGQVASIATVET